MFKNIIKLSEEINTFKKGTSVVFNDPDFGDTEAVIERDSTPYENSVQIRIKERPMTLHVDKSKIKILNRDVLI